MAFSAENGPASQGSLSDPLQDSLQEALQDALQNSWRSAWPSLVRIILVEILALLVLAGALVYYLNWSSQATVAEFMAAGKIPLAVGAPPRAVNVPCERTRDSRSDVEALGEWI